MSSTQSLIRFVREFYQSNEFIPLHAPHFNGNEKSYVLDTIDSTFVSSVGAYVDLFERQVAEFTNASSAIATVNGTAALYSALYVAGVRPNELVITQALTFVATCNVIAQLGAQPVFVDVERATLGMCPRALETFLDQHCHLKEGMCFHSSGSRIAAVVPMHTFGHPVQIHEINRVCARFGITVVEDAAESLGSFYKGQHTGTFSPFAALSFNGNKVITTGGGGMVLCESQEVGKRVKHITTTAKVAHAYEFYHDELAFNFRMPNINAALGCGQMEQLHAYLSAKRALALAYQAHFDGSELEFVCEPEHAQSNYWLNAVICADKHHRDEFLEMTNKAGVMTRPVWQLMHTLPMFKNAIRGPLDMSVWLAERIVNLPSSVPTVSEVK
ncbi:LegC family aminotransferase [Pseudoalteromonas sp. SSDWG2]|uniref:LegC family aminotransferase n=1 Tax=Pseudoalteromonas sp. SSDWG2 TaxID=3139391 RepID=UPI003BAB8FCA